jgi:hypothetical protein
MHPATHRLTADLDAVTIGGGGARTSSAKR